MAKNFYIPRTLQDKNRTYSEAELLTSSQYIVVLAEPEGGKTELLGSLATQLQTKRISASCFRYQQSSKRKVLVLDAFDEVIFGLTHLLGFSFAPRIKNIGKQTLYIFRPKNRTSPDWKITPDKTINTDLIHDNWDDLLRLVTTITLKENTASDIFRRLNSYSRQHALYQTLKAFGQIIKSLFILRYVNDVELRQAIEKQLNKVELSNRFTRAVVVGSPREYMQVEKEEQEIAEGCNRLIKNSIICWNYLYLERQLERLTEQEAKENLLSVVATHSPMTWTHINMLGEYDFSDEKLKDSVGILPPKSVT